MEDVDSIIKGIRCCYDDDPYKNGCEECPYYGRGGLCLQVLMKDAVDTIVMMNKAWMEIENIISTQMKAAAYAGKKGRAKTLKELHDLMFIRSDNWNHRIPRIPTKKG